MNLSGGTEEVLTSREREAFIDLAKAARTRNQADRYSGGHQQVATQVARLAVVVDRLAARSTDGGDRPLIGSLTVPAQGTPEDTVRSVMYEVRRIQRGGRYT